MQLFDSADTGMVSTKSTSVKVKTPKSTAAPATAEANVTYLDVHCGVSVGTMAGIDVGAAGRFEYLILGPPMAEVAIAEGDAGKGELVITPGAHSYLHRYTGSSLDAEQTSNNGTDLKNKPQASPKREAPQVGEEGASCFCFGRRSAPQVHPSNSNTSGTTQGSDSPNSPLRTKPAAPTTDAFNDVPGTKLPCGCTVTSSGFFLIDSNPKAPFDTKIGRTRVPKTLVQFAAKEILSDVSKSFEVIRTRVGECDSQLKSWKDAPGEFIIHLIFLFYLHDSFSTFPNCLIILIPYQWQPARASCPTTTCAGRVTALSKTSPCTFMRQRAAPATT